MNSFNHYSLGAVGTWLYSGAAGIRPDDASPGYKHFFLAPQFTTRLAHVKATFNSPYGTIASGWRAERDQIVYDITIPPNSSATLELPGKSSTTLAAGTYHFSTPRQSIR